jgi:hypothetical protein
MQYQARGRLTHDILSVTSINTSRRSISVVGEVGGIFFGPNLVTPLLTLIAYMRPRCIELAAGEYHGIRWEELLH